MKQNITREQKEELSFEEYTKLNKWARQRNYETGLSIGQMIEFLNDHLSDRQLILTTGLKDSNWWNRKEKWAVGFGFKDEPIKNSETKWFADDLCDDLWEAVKRVLEE